MKIIFWRILWKIKLLKTGKAILSPLINKYILQFSKRTFIIFLFISWAFLYSAGGVLGNEYYSLIRAFFFYILGAFIKLHSKEKFNAPKIVFAVLACLVLWALMTFCFYKNSLVHNEINSISFFDAVMNRIFFILEHCISLPVFAFLFFKIFMSLNLKENSFINKISSLTFGVYLIHDSAFGRFFIWNHLLHISDRQFSSKYFPVFAVLDILLVFFVSSVLSSLMLHFTQKIESKWKRWFLHLWCRENKKRFIYKSPMIAWWIFLMLGIVFLN